MAQDDFEADFLSALSQRLDRNWNAIQKARDEADNKYASLSIALNDHTTEDTSMVVFGSLARREITSGSDLDWVLLVDGAASSEHLDASLAIEGYLQNEKHKGPGSEATFGGLVFSHDLVHYIGGQDDSNRNLTQRLLMLLESIPIGRSEAHNRVVNNILRRYILEDYGWMHARNPSNVPRFLHNDIVRYWRTLAVDFAYKRRQRQGKGWALRTAKLRLSRKLTYAAGLLTCYSCALEPTLRNLESGATKDSAAHAVVAHLADYVRLTPLDIVSKVLLENDQLTEVAPRLLDAYNEFLNILNDDESRRRLDTLQYDEIATDATYQRVRELGHEFQDGLNEIFFSPERHNDFYQLTRTYGVF